MNLIPNKYSYQEFMELSIYADLKTSLRVNDRLSVSSNEELADVKDILIDVNIPFILKSKREIWIAPES